MAVIEVCAGYTYHLGDQVPADWAVCGGAALGALGVCRQGRRESPALLQCWELWVCVYPGQKGKLSSPAMSAHSPKLQLLPLHLPKQIKAGNPVQPAPRSLGGRNATWGSERSLLYHERLFILAEATHEQSSFSCTYPCCAKSAARGICGHP